VLDVVAEIEPIHTDEIVRDVSTSLNVTIDGADMLG
jgi:hypothetical protein